MTRPFLAAAVLAVSTGLADAGEPKLAFDVIPLFERYDPTYRADRAAARQPLNGLAERFWTARDFPDGPALAARMAARIREGLAHGGGAEGGTYYRNALQRLAAVGTP